MEFSTVGRKIHPGARFFIKCCDNEDLSGVARPQDRFRLVYVETGAGILNCGGIRTVFNAPALFCLNEQELPTLENTGDFFAKSVYFHPSFINSVFCFENMREDSETLTATEQNDRTFLKPFFIRTEKYRGLINLGPSTAKRISKLMDILYNELTLQGDCYWPCRSRSFFLEILFIIDRLFFVSEAVDNTVLAAEDTIPADEQNEMGKILLYLHLNYGEKISLTGLTKAFNINRTSLNRQFGRETGSPVMTYLIRLRIRLACTLLRDTALPVSEILERVGFMDEAHFSRMFRKYTGCSPTEYRQNYCWLLT